MNSIKSICFAAVLCSTGVLHGAEYYWSGSFNDQFQETINWWHDAGMTQQATSLPGSEDTIYLNTSNFTPGINNPLLAFSGDRALKGIRWNGTQSQSLGLAGETVTLGASGMTLDDWSAELRIGSALQLTAAQTWYNGSTGNLVLEGPVTLASALNLTGASGYDFTQLLQVNGSRTISVQGNTSARFASLNLTNSTLTIATESSVPVEILGTTTGASGNLEKHGTGTLVLHESAGFSGNLRIREGEIVLRKSNLATNQLLFGAATGVAGLDGYGILSLERSDTQRVSYQLGGNTYVHATSDGAWIRAVGEGALAPTLAMSGERVFIVRPLTDFSETRLLVDVGLADGNSAGALSKRGAATMTVTGVNTYTGSTNIDRGRLVLDYQTHHGDNKLSNTAATRLRGGTLQLLGHATEGTRELVGSMEVGVGISTLELTSQNGQAMELVINGNLSRASNTGSVGTGATTANSNGILNLVINDPQKTRLGVLGSALQNNAAGFIGGWFVFNGNRWATRQGDWIEAYQGSVIRQNLEEWQADDDVILEQNGIGKLVTSSVQSLIIDSGQSTSLEINNQASTLTLTQGAMLVSSDTLGQTYLTGGQLMSHNTAYGTVREMMITNLSDSALTLSTNFGGSNTYLSATQNLLLSGKGAIELLGANWSIGQANNLSVGIGGHVRTYSSNALGAYGSVVLGGGHEEAVNGAWLELVNDQLVIGRLSGGRSGDIAYGEFGPGVVSIGANQRLTLNQGLDSTFQGMLSGTGTILKRGGGMLTLTNHTSTFGGQVQIHGGTLMLTGGIPTLSAIASLQVRGGGITVQQSNSSGSMDHLRNGTLVTLQGTRGHGFRLNSTLNIGVTETIQGFKFEGGQNVLTLTNTHSNPTAATTTLSLGGGANTTTRSEKATLLVRGQNLGATAAAGVAASRLTFTTASNITNALVGGGASTAGSKTLSILPYAIGENATNSASTLGAVGNSFLTYGAGATGLRVLTDAEYGQFTTAGTKENVSVNQSLTGQSEKILNALRVVSSEGNVNLAGAGRLELTSGALLFSAGSTLNSASLEYGSLTSGTVTKELVVSVTSSHANAAAAQASLNASVVDNGAHAVSLTKAGDGLLVLAANNTYTGETTVNAGILEFGSGTNGNLGSGMLRMGGGTLRWGAGNTTDISAANRPISLLGGSVYLSPGYGGHVLNVGNVFDVGANHVVLSESVGQAGYGGLTKIGTGNLTFAKSLNYSGATVIQQGRVDFNGGISANTTEALYLVNHLAGKQHLIANVVGDLNTKSLVVGGAYFSAGATKGTLTVSQGAVHIEDSSGFVQIGYRDPTAGNGNNENSVSVADFSQASGVTLRTSLVEVGMYKGTPGSHGIAGELLLSNGQNLINSGGIIVGSTPSVFGNVAVTSKLVFGSSSNRVETDTMVIGGARSLASATIRAGGSFFLRGQQGGQTGANLFIGDNDMIDTNIVTVGTMDLRGASQVDANVNSLILGRIAKSGGGGGGRGILRFDTGEIRATTIQMAHYNYSAPTLVNNVSATQGTLQQLGNATLRYQTLRSESTHTTTVQGVEISSSVATHDWRGGTLKNLDDQDLRNVNVTVSLNQHESQSLWDASLRTVEVTANRKAIFESQAELDGGGSFQKTGLGTLELQGVNLNTGNVRVLEGTVALSQSGSMSDVAWIDLANAGTFSVRQRVDSSYTTDATISGTGHLDASGGTFSVGSQEGAILTHGVLKPGASSVAVSQAQASTVGNQTGTLRVSGNLRLFGGASSVTRAQLQVGATNRNIMSSRGSYASAEAWVDQLASAQPSLLTHAGTQHDLITVSGNLTLERHGQIEVLAAEGYTGVEGDVFNLFDWATVNAQDFVVGARYQTGDETGQDLKLFALGGDLHWDTSLFLSHGALVIVTIPEPEQALMLALGVAVIGFRRRRFKRDL